MGELRAEVRLFASLETLLQEAAEEFVELAQAAVRAKDLFAVALSGGSTPRGLYGLLAASPFQERVPWSKIHFFWGDERHVPPDHPDSNYRMAHEAMLSKVPVLAQNIHRIPAEKEAKRAAADYEEALREFFRLGGGQWPRFDLILLGMGPDGHTASLFPHTDALQEQARLVAAPWIEKLSGFRITLTPPVLNRAACVIFIATGAEKAEVLRQVIQGSYQPELYPAQLVRPASGRLLWLVDRESARLLPLASESAKRNEGR